MNSNYLNNNLKQIPQEFIDAIIAFIEKDITKKSKTRIFMKG